MRLVQSLPHSVLSIEERRGKKERDGEVQIDWPRGGIVGTLGMKAESSRERTWERMGGHPSSLLPNILVLPPSTVLGIQEWMGRGGKKTKGYELSICVALSPGKITDQWEQRRGEEEVSVQIQLWNCKRGTARGDVHWNKWGHAIDWVSDRRSESCHGSIMCIWCVKIREKTLTFPEFWRFSSRNEAEVVKWKEEEKDKTCASYQFIGKSGESLHSVAKGSLAPPLFPLCLKGESPLLSQWERETNWRDEWTDGSREIN